MENQRQPTLDPPCAGTGANEEPERILAGRARACREELGLTQSEIAEAMTARGHSMGQSTIAKIEKAQRPVRLNEAAALAAVLRVSLDDLVTDPGRRGQRDVLAAAQQAVSDGADRLESALARRDAARAEAEALAAAEGE